MSSKSELTKTIETQQLRITRLEQRIADVVAAYKSLQKEKDALESTVRVLTATDETKTSENDPNVSSTPTKETDESGSEVETSSTTGSEQQQTSSQEKLRTLQQHLAVITEQKNRMEQMFQSDKRKIKNENDELKKSIEELKAENIVLKEKSENEIKELKKLLRESQRDFERKTADHGVTVRELQTSLSAERNKLELLEHQYDESRAKVVTLETQMDALKKQHTSLNNQFQTKLSETKEKDLIDSGELKRSKEMCDELTNKLKEMEIEHAEQIRNESKRNQQLEKKITQLNEENAQRLSKNESHVAELSEQIGLIEKQRAQDQMTIQRLKERLAQLDVENALLTKATTFEHEENQSDEIENENHPDLESVMKHLAKIKVLIRMANDRFGKSLTIEEILNIDREMSSVDGTTSEKNPLLHVKCQEEIERLKCELDKYRTKTVAALKAKTFKDSHTTKELDDVRLQNDQLREKLIQSQSLYNNEIDRHNQVVEKLQTCLTNIRDQHRHEIDQILSRKRVEINELESELEKQRERTVRLLDEKDRELETLGKQISQRKTTETNLTIDIPPVDVETPTILNELFPHASTIGGPGTTTNGENNILYFIQEQQIKDQEINILKKQRFDLDLAMRDLQRQHAYEISQLQINVEHLQDELEQKKLTEQRHENLTKNEHNIDYIKNVFYHYLLATDQQVKNTMANALMTILHFSTKEKAKIESLKGNHSLTTNGWFSKS